MKRVMEHTGEIVEVVLRIILAITILGGFGFIAVMTVYNYNHPYNLFLSDRREMEGTIFSSSNNYTEIITDDGLKWYVNNFSSNVGVRCTVLFDTKNTDAPEDDIVVEITTHTSIR